MCCKIIITYYYVVITSLLHHYCIIITSILHHYCIIITSLLCHYNNESIITYYYISCFHYNAIITYYYHDYHYYVFEAGQLADDQSKLGLPVVSWHCSKIINGRKITESKSSIWNLILMDIIIWRARSPGPGFA